MKLTPAFMIDVTEDEAWQLLHPATSEYKSVYMNIREDDPDFESDFSRMDSQAIQFVWNGEPLVTALVINVVTPEAQCIAENRLFGQKGSPDKYRIDLSLKEGEFEHHSAAPTVPSLEVHEPDKLQGVFLAEWLKFNSHQFSEDLEHGEPRLLQSLLQNPFSFDYTKDMKGWNPLALSQRDKKIVSLFVGWLGTDSGIQFLRQVNEASGEGLIAEL